jgi:PilZ domain
MWSTDQRNQQGRLIGERRRSKSVAVTCEIEVSGLGLKGVPFHDLALAADVSEHGCRLNLSREVTRGDVLAIRLVSQVGGATHPESPFLLYEVVWAESSAVGWTAGLLTLETGKPWLYL